MSTEKGPARRKKWMDHSARVGKAMKEKAEEAARVPRPDWMDNPALLPKHPPGRKVDP